VKELGYTLQALETCGNESSVSTLRINTLGLNAVNMIKVIAFLLFCIATVLDWRNYI
jgi:hypothetical protein